MNIITKWKSETVFDCGLYCIFQEGKWLYNLHGEEIGFNKESTAVKFIEVEKESLEKYFKGL